jgi:murein DD-endopeptidase MepM/ murein hydrolase activator NlpD
MEKPLFPSKYMRITQGYNEGTHKDSFAIDNADIDYNISPIYAPFTGIIKKTYPNDANEVWLESIDEVEYPDGTIDFMTIMFAHSNDISNLFVGKRINKGEIFYYEGTKGNTTGNHCHIECGKGKFTGTGWHKNNANYWSINSGKRPEECLWIDESINIIDNYGYNFKKISTNIVDNPKKEEKPVNKKEFIAPKTDLYGVYLKENQKLIIEQVPKSS